MATRREFLDAIVVGAAGMVIGTTARSYGRILGSNDRLNFAVIGLNGRGQAHLASLKANRNAARISHVRRQKRTSGTSWNRKKSTQLPSRHRITGTRRWQSPLC